MNDQTTRVLVRRIVRFLARVEAHGLENIPSGPFIVASNHLGRLDAALVYCFLDRTDVSMMVAEKYQKNPVWLWFGRQMDVIWVDRFNADLGAMRTALNRLKGGGVLVLAPEGTRSPTAAMIIGRSGSSYLAAKAGVPVLPVAITGSEDRRAYRNWLHLRSTPVVIRAGTPFILPPMKSSRTREGQLQQYTDEIMCQVAALLPPDYRGVYTHHPRLKQLVGDPVEKSLAGGLLR